MGYVFVDWQRARADSKKNLNPTDLEKITGISKTTILKMKKGLKVQDKKAHIVLRALDVEHPREYLSETPNHLPKKSHDPRRRFNHWQLLENPVTASTESRIPCRVAQAQHELDKRLGRARCYDLEAFSDDEIDYLKNVLLNRHPKICLELEGHPNFPQYYDCGFIGRDIYWVIDKYEDGKTLTELVKNEEIEATDVPQIAREMAEGLLALNEKGVVRRELTPDFVMLREKDKSVLLLDFELAKVKSTISSRPLNWSRNPFFAPEVDSPDVDCRADVFGWGQIVTYCLTGKTPTIGSEPSVLNSAKIPKAVYRLLYDCLEKQRSLRRVKDFRQVLNEIKDWK